MAQHDLFLQGVIVVECTCIVCGKIFEGRKNARLCSDECKLRRAAAKKRQRRIENRPQKTCPICGEVFAPIGRLRKYCSYECAQGTERVRQAERRSAENDFAPAPPERKNHCTMADLARIAKEAAERHMSYGEYVRIMEARGRL